MNIILFYEHLVREWAASQRIRKEFEKNGDRVRVYSIIFERTKAQFDALIHKPDIILLPWFLSDEHEMILSPFLQINPDVKIVNLHQEQIGSPNSTKSLYCKTTFTQNGCYHFVWGSYFRNTLVNENGVKEDRVFITGNTRNDAIARPQITREELAKEYGLDPEKRWVLFAENRGWIIQRNTPAMKRLLLERGESVEEFEKNVEESKRELKEFAEEMNKFSDEFVSGFEFIYRPHPGTAFDYEVPQCVHIIGNRQIYDWIHHADLFLTCESTSIFEAEICGKPCATIAKTEMIALENRMAGVHDYPRIYSLSEINDAFIDQLKKRFEKEKPIYEKYLGKVDGKAAERVVEITKKLKDYPIEKQFQKYKKASFAYIARQALYEAAVWFMVSFGLFEKYRFPKSAYPEKRDIPFSKENKWIRE